MTTATAEKLMAEALRLEKAYAERPAFVLDGGQLRLRDDVAIGRGDAARVPGNLAVRLPVLAPGQDYLVCYHAGELEAVEATRELLADTELVGGFHYGLGGNALARAGGDDVPAINASSIWDLAFRPSCPDPGGMAYVAGVPGSAGVAPFWADIYLLGVDHLVQGSSVAGATIADGDRNKPKTATGVEDKLDFATAKRILGGHGKQLMSVTEFAAAAYGVTERTTAGARPKLTGLDAPRTSRCGLMQATGNLYVWGHDGDPDEPRACILGGGWDGGDWAGSRCAGVGLWPDYSVVWLGARGRSDHLQLG